MNLLLFADLNLNLIDGSSIWVRNVAEVLTRYPGTQVFVLSRDAPTGSGVVGALQRTPGVTLLARGDYEPAATGAGAQDGALAGVVRRVDTEVGLDRIIIRGAAVARSVAADPALRTKLWAYVLDVPPLADVTRGEAIQRLVTDARGILVQSEAQRALLEAIYAGASGKVDVLPPMVRPLAIAPEPARRDAGQVRFIYSGKYSLAWNVETYFDIPAACKAAGIDAVVTMIGDKVHNESSDRGFRSRIEHKSVHTEGVAWLGALDHELAIQESAKHDLGLCWRSDAVNDSLEISTKFLEFASVGVPCIVNRTATYVSLLGADYPFFAGSMADVVGAAATLRSEPELYARMRERCRRLASEYTFDKASERLSRALNLAPKRPVVGKRPKVLIASHDLKFLSIALQRLGDIGAHDIVHDRWRSTTRHDEKESLALLKSADVIFCEWCFGQAVWYSKHKRPDQKLFIRLHRAEAFTNFPREVDPAAVDGVLVVSDYFKSLCIDEFKWPAEKIQVLPQYCAADQFARPKYPEADRTLGFVGMNGFRHKRLDRAIQILRLVRQKAPDFRLRVRSAMPWEISWIWNSEDERRQFAALFRELEADRTLRDAIIFDRAGPDMPEWFRKVGFILSTSETEGCHTSVAEGICSAAVPIVINWPGAASVYGDSCVYQTVEEMADAVLRHAAATDREAQAEQLRRSGAERFDVPLTVAQLDSWFSGGLDR